MVVLREIPESLIINLDQTGIKLVPNGDWTMAQQGSRRIEVVGIGDKRQITATYICSCYGWYILTNAGSLPGENHTLPP